MDCTRGTDHIDEMGTDVEAEDWEHADRLARMAPAEFLQDVALSLDPCAPAIPAHLQILGTELSAK